MATRAFVFCAIDIYPFEGGIYSFFASNGSSQVLSCNVSQTLDSGGSFSITLAPGGPNGIAASPSWSEVLTPMSFVVIAMQREDHSNVVMLGVITNIEESQTWSANNVIRTITVTGFDFFYFFNHFSWNSLSFMAGNALNVIGSTINNTALGYILNYGFSDTPQALANKFYNFIMLNPNGIMGKTAIPYQGKNIFIGDALGAFIDPYPNTHIVPSATNFMSEDSTWANKFQRILPFPIYEWFVATGPLNTWGTIQSGGLAFTSTLLPQAVAATPQMVGRINPQPILEVNPNNSGYYSPAITGTVNDNLFTALNTYQIENQGFISSNIQFGVNGVKNFYIINPLGLNLLFGGNKANSSIYSMTYPLIADPASIHRYGFSPYSFTTEWLNDSTVIQPVQSDTEIADIVIDMNTRISSYCEPLPLMANATVTMELRPDIFPGNTFQYNPFVQQANNLWLFYIESVSHNYVFGGPSTTTLQLSRGLPVTVYADQNLMSNILIGNAQRLNGQYVSGLPSGVGAPLVGYTVSNGGQTQILADIGKFYVTPQPQ